MRRPTTATLLAALALLGLLGCGAGTSGAAAPAAPGTPVGTPAANDLVLQGEVVVLAAASLTDAFTVLADRFMAEHPRVTVTTGYGPSSGLAAQVTAGAPVDVLATADERTMELALADMAVDDAVAVQPVVFARNSMAIAVPRGNPGDVTGVEDLARTDVTFAVCRQEVPCGSGAVRVLAAAGIDRPPVTFESDARGVLTKVLLGEVDAGLVYASDVRPAAPAVQEGEVIGVRLPDDVATSTHYPIVALPGSGDLGRAFVDFVLSDEGTRVLGDAGFLLP